MTISGSPIKVSAIKYHECHLKSEKELGKKIGQGTAKSSLGNANYSLEDVKAAIEFRERRMKIA